jgi:hypothetical protein
MSSVISDGLDEFMGPNLVYLPLFIIRIISAQLVFGSIAFRQFS